MPLTIRGKLPPGARWTNVHVLCPDNPQHGAVYTLTTFDGEFVGTRLESEESTVESVVGPAEYPEVLAAHERALTPATPEEAGGEELAAQLNAFNAAMFGDSVPPVASFDPDEQGHTRHRVRCPRPSCALDLPLTSPAIHALEEYTRAVWRQGVAERNIPSEETRWKDVRYWLNNLRRP